MKQVIRKGMVPPGGWHFFEGGTKITGHSYPNLIDNIGKFRIANQLEYGDPAKSYETYACNNWPRFCIPSYTEREAEKLDIEVAEAKQERTALEQTRLWGKIVTYSRGTRWKDLVPKEESQARSDICKTCALNQPISQISSCHACVQELDRQSTMTREGKEVDKQLGFCGSTFQDNRSAVWLPKEGLERSLNRVDQTVEECWLRTL